MEIDMEQLEQDLMDTAELLERLGEGADPKLKALAKTGADKLNEYAVKIGNGLYG